jgi:hypothetical protein
MPNSFPRCLYHVIKTQEHPELQKLLYCYCWRQSLGPLTPEELFERNLQSSEGMQMLLKQREKVLQQPQVEEIKCKNKQFSNFTKGCFFQTTSCKETFRCGENAIYVVLMLTKPHG